MPRLSLYRPQKSNDYKFLDRNIKEMFQVGGTDLYIHKYLGPSDQGPSNDFTQPQITTPDPTKIQDLLFLENRDRKYAPDIYRIRGHYNVQNLDFDLSQFGLFLNNDIIFITVHYNEMIELIGRKLMVGDVFELPHLTDYHPLNETIPIGLRRYYQITDANFASEGFSSTWYPHLWRIKCEPLVDSQEFSNILSQPFNKDTHMGDWNATAVYTRDSVVTYGDKNYTALTDVPVGTPCVGVAYDDRTVYPADTLITVTNTDGSTTTYKTVQQVPLGTDLTDTAYFTPLWELNVADSLRDVLGRYKTNLAINDAAIKEAARILPKTGYDRSQLYLVPTTNGKPQTPVNIVINNGAPVATRGTVEKLYSPGFAIPSPVIRIGAASINNFFKLTGEDADALKKYLKISLESANLAPERTDGNSGQVKGDLVIAATALGAVTGPYGTADNTYSSADQYPPITLTTSTLTTNNQTTLTVINLFPTETPSTWYRNPGLEVEISVTTAQGLSIEAFSYGTKIVSVDETENTITIDMPTIAGIPAGSSITVGAGFTGNPIEQNVMDFRADADPRFQFIVKQSPEGFGYLSGYMAGDGTAPNGLPTGAGISFPLNPKVGDYFLRTDYLPQLLYRWNGALWIKISENVRTEFGMNQASTQLGSFVNNTNTTTLTNGTTIPEQQSLSNILRIQAD